MRVRFGDFTFDGDTRELLRGAAPVHVSPKAFRFLELLLESRPRALSKGDLQEKIWPSTFVSEENLASLAAEVRERWRRGPLRAVRPNGLRLRLRLRRGGRGRATAPGSATGPALPRRGQARARALRRREHRGTGRRRCRADRRPDRLRHHARLVVEGSTVTVEDLDSKNGSFVEGKRLKARRVLKSGDIVKFGSVVMTFRAWSPETSTESARTDGSG